MQWKHALIFYSIGRVLYVSQQIYWNQSRFCFGTLKILQTQLNLALDIGKGGFKFR